MSETAENGPARTSVLLLGDCILLRPPEAGDGAESLFDLLRSCDHVIGNCEMTLSTQGQLESKDISCADPARARDLAQLGIGVVSLANNHSTDLGAEGLLDTLEALEEAGVLVSGAGRNLNEAARPVVMGTKAGQKIALLSFYCADSRSILKSAATRVRPGVAVIRSHSVQEAAGPAISVTTGIDEDDLASMQDAIRSARSANDTVIVSLHTHLGEQGAYALTRPIAQAAIDTGAEAVFCHGSHALEPIEAYRGKLVFYGLGNFFFQLYRDNRVAAGFGENWAYKSMLYSFTTSNEYWESLAVRLNFQAGKVETIEAFPVEITRDGNPRLAPDALGRDIILDLADRCEGLGVVLRYDRGQATICCKA